MLSTLVSRHRAELYNEPWVRGESFEAHKARLLKNQHSLSIW